MWEVLLKTQSKTTLSFLLRNYHKCIPKISENAILYTLFKISRRFIVKGVTIFAAFFFSSTLWAQSFSHNPLHLDWIDNKVAPSENFYRYANGTWQKNNPIPPQYAVWGVFGILEKETREKIHTLLQSLANASSTKPGSLEQKVGDFYYSGMDETLINKVRLDPLKPDFDKINTMTDKKDLAPVIAELHKIGVDCFFGFDSMADFKSSQDMIAVISQGGLGLPDRDYYLKEDAKFSEIRKAYVAHVAKMFELMGEAPEKAENAANRVMNIETAIAKASMSQTAQRDPVAVYHMMPVEELSRLTQAFDWPLYFKTIGAPKFTQLNVAMPDFFKAMNQLLIDTPIEDLKMYLSWQLLDSFAPWLSDDIVQENFHMSQVLNGTKEMQPRWLRVVNTESAALGFAIGELYVEKYFPKDTKRQVQEILDNIRAELKKDLKKLSWMTPKTREAALKKLSLMRDRIGYPDKWWDYSKLQIDRGPYVENVRRANVFLVMRGLDKIGKKVDRTEWAMTPQTINAYYDPSMNEINLTAAILQPPFFDPYAPKAMNYGAIGFVIGHELTHGFDDQGAKFDGHGNLKDWWQAEDLKKFKAATDCIVQQFSSYQVAPGLFIQGPLVVGEAAADLGGMTLALRAFLASKDGKKARTIEGMTPMQQFFLGAAHVWAGNMREEQLRNQVTVDPHPPMEFRVNGTLANMPAFWKVFGVTEPGLMRNKKPCIVW